MAANCSLQAPADGSAPRSKDWKLRRASAERAEGLLTGWRTHGADNANRPRRQHPLGKEQL